MKFHYQARDKNGETQAGVVEASSRDAALKVLGEHGLFVTLLDETGARSAYEMEINIFDRISMRDVMLFSRQLSIMFRSRVPLVEGLQTLGTQTRKKGFRETIMKISEEVEAGTSFSQALGNFPDAFSSFYVNMVKSGEASGQLSETLSYLAEHLEREYTLQNKIRGALIYPAFIVFIAFSVLFLLMFFVMPNLTKVLQETGQQLPLVTQMVIRATDILKSWGWLVGLFLVGGVLLLLRYIKTPQGKRMYDRFILGVPILGGVLRTVYLTRFAENISTLIEGGIPIARSLSITGDIVGSTVFQDIIREAEKEVQTGSRISTILQKYPREFPPVFTQMVFVGEKSGSLDSVLKNTVAFYQDEVERAVEGFLSILEPLLIVTLGVMVGGLMASVLLPLYQMASL